MKFLLRHFITTTISIQESNVVYDLKLVVPNNSYYINDEIKISYSYNFDKNVLEGISKVLTPMRVLFGGVATVLGYVSYAAYKGAEEAEKFNNS